MLKGVVSTLYDWGKVYEEEQAEKRKEDFRGPVYEGGDFVDTVTANTLLKIEEAKERTAGKIKKNRFVKLGAISIAGIVLLNNIK